MATTPGFTDSMSDADALMWTIERDPLLRSTITAVALLDRAPDWDSVQRKMAWAADAVPRLRQRVVEPAHGIGTPQWVEDAELDLRFHLRRIALPAPARLADAVALACAAAMEGFDRARPLWQFTIVEGLEGGRAALIQKVHHSATDGVGGVRLLVELLDAERGAAGRPPLAEHVASPVPANAGGRSWLARSARLSLGAATELPRNLARLASWLTTSPAAIPGRVARNARSAAKLLAPTTNPLSRVMHGRSLGWQFDTLDVDLESLRAAANTVGGSLNDGFLAAVAGGMRRYHELHGAAVDELRMTLPISIRGDADPLAGNRFVPVRFAMPVGDPDPAARVRIARRLVADWRAEPALRMSDALAGALNRLPAAAVTSLFGGMLKNVDFVATNVAGLPVPMYLGGAELLRQYAFAPLSGAAVNIALLSHVGTCCVGINSDAAAVPDPDVLTSCIRAGFDEVLSLGPVAVASPRAS